MSTPPWLTRSACPSPSMLVRPTCTIRASTSCLRMPLMIRCWRLIPRTAGHCPPPPRRVRWRCRRGQASAASVRGGPAIANHEPVRVEVCLRGCEDCFPGDGLDPGGIAVEVVESEAVLLDREQQIDHPARGPPARAAGCRPGSSCASAISSSVTSSERRRASSVTMPSIARGRRCPDRHLPAPSRRCSPSRRQLAVGVVGESLLVADICAKPAHQPELPEDQVAHHQGGVSVVIARGRVG